MITVAAEDIFLLSDKRTVLVRLPSFDWNFTLGTTVRLRAGPYMLHGKQIGTGNHEGRATILLSPGVIWKDAVTQFRNLKESGIPISLEEVSRG